jgi:hypothetical protein
MPELTNDSGVPVLPAESVRDYVTVLGTSGSFKSAFIPPGLLAELLESERPVIFIDLKGGEEIAVGKPEDIEKVRAMDRYKKPKEQKGDEPCKR